MKLLITGVSGYVGRTLIDKLSVNNDIYAIGRTDPKITGILFFEADISNKISIQSVASSIDTDFDAILHMAAYVPKSNEDDSATASTEVNIIGTNNLIETFGGRFRQLIIGSSAEVYDMGKISKTIDEDSLLGPKTYYGATKLASEFMSNVYAKKFGFNVIILRFSVMYGGHDPITRALPNFIRKSLADENLDVYGGTTLRDYIHVEDVASSIVCALGKPGLSGVYNIGTGVGVSIAEAATAIVKATSSNSRIVEHPGVGVDVVMNIEKAKIDLNFSPKYIFPDMLSDMCESYKND